MENVNIKRFKDLKVGDTIYVTDRWDFFKLTIAGIDEGDNENGAYMKLTFLDDCEFAHCDNALNIDSCFQIDKGYLEDFCIESYGDCIFFADKEEYKDYLKTLQERAGDAIEKINKSHYAWNYIDEYGKMTQSKSFETMGECYRDMHKNVLLKLDSLTCGMENMWYEIKFETDNITINDNEQRWDWCIVEVV